MAAYTFEKSQINTDSLDQSTTWFDRKGREYKIDDMNSYHCIGAMNKLIEAFGAKAFKSQLFEALLAQAKK